MNFKIRNTLCLFQLTLAFSSFAKFSQICESGFLAYEKHLYPVLKESCTKCHNGSRKVPPFVTDDISKSYLHVLRYMEFSKIEDSLLAVQAINGHCGIEKCENNFEVLEAAKLWWENGEKQCVRKGKFFSTQVMVPQNLPTLAEGWTTLQFPLSDLGPDFKNSTLSLEVQDFIPTSSETRGAWRFRAPRVHQSKGRVHVSDMKVLLNSNWDMSENAFIHIDQSFHSQKVSADSIQTPLLSNQTMILVKDSNPNPKLQISFEKIEALLPQECPQVDKFEALVLPILKAQNCLECHNANSENKNARTLNLDQSTSELCKNVYDYVDKRFIGESSLISIPARGLYGHPKADAAMTRDLLNNVEAWIK